MKIIYMGTPDFSVPSLEELCKRGHDVCAVFTKPDKKQGRKMVLTQSPVKQLAERLGVPVFQPETLKDDDVYDQILKLDPDMIVVVAYGRLLPKRILDIPKRGCVNVHGSILPKYRGAAPIQWSVINGDDFGGVTTMYMVEELDAGDILLCEETPISRDETAQELYDRLKIMGSKVLINTIDGLENQTVTAVKQDDDKSTFAPMLSKDMAKIDFNKDSRSIHNLVRGMNIWPIAYTHLLGQPLKIYRTGFVMEKTDMSPGSIMKCNDKEGLFVACGGGSVIEIKTLQAVGRKVMSACDFARGNKIPKGTRFEVCP